jgi:hypothetical protein
MSYLRKEGLQLIYNENKYRNEYFQSSNVIRNKLINGAMTISQRGTTFNIPISNKDHKITDSNPPTYTLDRWFALASANNKLTITQENNNSEISPPTGFNNYMKITTSDTDPELSSEDYFAIGQYIDYSTYFNMDFGTPNAKPLTLSFMVYANLDGDYSGAISNYSSNRGNCSYAFKYNIPTANTWHNIVIPINGCNIGTWNNTTNLDVYFSLGCGSGLLGNPKAWRSAINIFGAVNTMSIIGYGATLCITGIQLEPSTIVSPFQFLLAPLELVMCQNYYQQLNLNYGNWPIFMTRTNNFEGGLNYNKTYGSINLINYLRTTSPIITFSNNVWTITGMASNGNLNSGIFHTNNGTGVLQNSSVYVDNPNVGPVVNVNKPLPGYLDKNGVTLNSAWNISVTVNNNALITTDYSFNINLLDSSALTINTIYGYCFVWTPTASITAYINAEIYPNIAPPP